MHLQCFASAVVVASFRLMRERFKQPNKLSTDKVLVRGLNEIEPWHRENETGVSSVLGAGRTPPSIVGEFEGTACTRTEELKSLWSWRDGGISAVPFVWYHDFLPLREALSEYKWLLLNPLVQCDPHYIPIFSLFAKCARFTKSTIVIIVFRTLCSRASNR
jgi:hypothetical protein